ncbi:hypothetical protein [Mucilaginibacter sp.]|jgi:hypothetical protein|uniref:DUF7665 family protein n=1 Tax=Mucilaginibacter sp. TaxID=1882438 RepID=UPI0035613232
MKTMDLLMFEKHISEFEFQHGVESGMWGLQTEAPAITWPFVTIWVQALATYYPPEKCYLRFTLNDYPQSAPTACPWDIENGTILTAGIWPKGSAKLNPVFNPAWNNATALYAPFDRLAIPGHDGWKTQYPEYYWQSSFKITAYLQFIHRLLNT